jgi:putative hydrolase of the HAD superfamily
MPLQSPLPPVIFFDAVGTLLYPEPPAAQVYVSIGRHFGSRLDEQTVAARFRAAFRREEEVDYTAGLRTNEAREIDRWRNIVTEVLDDVADREACFQALFKHFSRIDAWRCAADAATILNMLSDRGHVLGIASNFDHRLRGLVENLPELRPIRHLVISSEVGWRKPASAFFDSMCRCVDTPAERILYVGDDPINDYQGARAAGMRAVLLDSRRCSAPEERHSIHTLRALTF